MLTDWSMDIMREPMEVESDSDEDYNLDNIVERRVVNGELKYFLKWECNKSQLQFEKRNLECPVVMDSFEKLSKDKKYSKNDNKDKKKSAPCSTAVKDLTSGKGKGKSKKDNKSELKKENSEVTANDKNQNVNEEISTMDLKEETSNLDEINSEKDKTTC